MEIVRTQFFEDDVASFDSSERLMMCLVYGLAELQKRQIRSERPVVSRQWELRCLSQYVNSKDNQITWRKQMNWEK
jgi:hypothetical protein